MNKAVQKEMLPNDVERNFIGKLMHGDFGLTQTFWIYGILVNFLFNLVSNLASSVALIVASLIIQIAYIVIVIIGIFRAADKYKGSSKSLPWLAKLISSIWAIQLGFALVLAFSTMSH